MSYIICYILPWYGEMKIGIGVSEYWSFSDSNIQKKSFIMSEVKDDYPILESRLTWTFQQSQRYVSLPQKGTMRLLGHLVLRNRNVKWQLKSMLSPFLQIYHILGSWNIIWNWWYLINVLFIVHLQHTEDRGYPNLINTSFLYHRG